MDPVHLQVALNQQLPAPLANDYKYSRGVVGAVVGSQRYPGAALLAVSAIQACEVGMVRFFGPERVADLVLLAHPEVVVASQVQDTANISSWVLGCGISADAQTQITNLALAAASGAPCVVDAGALDSLEFSALKSCPLILTPHAGELRRLVERWLPDRTDLVDTETESVRSQAASALAVELHQVVLAKGSITFIASPDGRVEAIGPNDPHLATAGTGDVLAGLLAGLAARNFTDWLSVASVAVRLHSAAATLAAKQGPVTAGGLPKFFAPARIQLEMRSA